MLLNRFLFADSKKPREPKCSRKKNSQKFTNYHPTNSKAKSPGFPLKDRKKVSKLVSEVVIESGDYICLSCSTPFSDYPLLVAHKKKCSEEKYLLAAEKLLKKPRIKKENVGFTDELSQYVTGKNHLFSFTYCYSSIRLIEFLAL